MCDYVDFGTIVFLICLIINNRISLNITMDCVNDDVNVAVLSDSERQ